jgi:hypothetical protein
MTEHNLIWVYMLWMRDCKIQLCIFKPYSCITSQAAMPGIETWRRRFSLQATSRENVW